MLSTAIAVLAMGQQLPENPSFDYSGMPSLSGPETIRNVQHSATVDMSSEKVATVETLTIYKNDSDQPVEATVIIPRYRIGDANSGNPTFTFRASWDKQPLKLQFSPSRVPAQKLEMDTKSYRYSSPLLAKVTIKPKATHALRLNYSLPFGRIGYEQKQRVVGYLFEGNRTVGTMNISYRYGGPTVFRLPESFPRDWKWQVGAKGVYIRQTDYVPTGELTFITFYPGGFENIGHPGKGGGGG